MTDATSTTPKHRLLVARRVPDAVAELARREFDAILVETDMDADAVIAATTAQGSQASFSGPKVKLTASHIAALPDSVRVIANPSAGTDHMDVAAARARGLVVTNAPDVLTDCTADLAFLLILAACRPDAAALHDMVLPHERDRRLMAVATWVPFFAPLLLAIALRTQLATLWTLPMWAMLPATPPERAAALWSFAYFFTLLAGYYVLRPLRDQMGIAGGVKNLPWLFTATFVTLIVAQPAYGALVFDQSGDVYGTTLTGGNSTCKCGVVFELVLTNGVWQENPIYAFTGEADGEYQRADLVFDKAGRL